jgi:outer membrane receptor protein involved in Fe transport
MQRSRCRKLKRVSETPRRLRGYLPVLLRRAPIAAAIMAALPRAYAAGPDDTGTAPLEQVVVTAEKRSENLQDVPISITALGTQKLEDLHINNFNDWVQYLPSVSTQGSASGGGASGPGFQRIFMRGVSSGDNGNHSGPLPTVGTYLDEQPVTTIQGAVDIHIYDIERVEALAGPQGTLYGASSEAGTVRIITNKPDPRGFKAGYNLSLDTTRGETGYVAEGFVNEPLSSNAAIRLVGWATRDPGFIDNVPGTVTFPSAGCVSNTNPPAPGCTSSPTLASNRFNSVDTYGARAALKVDLNDRWTITPTLMGQKTDAHGIFAVDPSLPGLLSTQRFNPDSISDKWWQLALTVEGRISDFDVTYAGGYLKRDDHTATDYTDYTLLYDKQTTYVSYLESNVGATINPSQFIVASDDYRKQSHELRITTPKERPLRFIGGLFYQRQTHYILQNYRIDELPTVNSVTGWPQTLWLTDQVRVDRDYAVFGELSYDFTPKLTGTVGYRFFRYDNSLDGFFGFGFDNPIGSHTGERATTFQPDGTPNADGTACVQPGILGGPCVNLSNEVKKDGSSPKFNLTYRFDENHLVYATYARGFRPGGINRRTQPPPNPSLATYEPDYLNSFEIGWKSSWQNNRLRFNGAFFWEDWNNFQFSFLGANSFTIVRNAGTARIKGVEAQLDWAPMQGLTLTAGATALDPKLTQDFCIDTDPATGAPYPLSTCPSWDAVPSGTRLPVVPKFKGNLVARYTFPVGGNFEAHVQGAVSYQSETNPALAPVATQYLGVQPAYAITDVLGGVSKGNFTAELFVSNAFDKRAQTYRYAECTQFVGSTSLFPGVPICALKPLANINTPRTLGLRFGQRF